MRYTNDAVTAMDAARRALDRAYGEELCMRLDPSLRHKVMHEVDLTIRSLDQVRRLIMAGIDAPDL